MAEKKGARNWTSIETNQFCSILADPVNRFIITLERKGLRKTSTKVVFKEALEKLKKSFQEEPFKSLNEEALKKKKSSELQLDEKKLQVKYNNMKQQWRKLRDRQKHGSGIAATKYPDWFEIINSVLSDTNQTMDNICSHPKNLSMITENDRDDDDDETALEYEKTLSNLAPATQSYSSIEVVSKTEVAPGYRDRKERAKFRYHTRNINCIGNARGNTKCTC